jgi:tRNA (cmo5U34)-methyltransferase
MKDKVFATPIHKQFEFDESVATVFDDMLTRSIPFYAEAQNLVRHCVCTHVNKSNTKEMLLYDLGCSTAATLLHIEPCTAQKNLRLVGIDNSHAMIEQAQKKLEAFGSKIELVLGDIVDFPYEKADIFISNYTLQFIRPLQREKFIQKLHTALKEDGIFIFSEKLISEHKELNKTLIDYYHDFKEKNGYSRYEIMQKREALENVLVPYTQNENIDMLKACGFSYCEAVFRWGNFATFIAFK